MGLILDNSGFHNVPREYIKKKKKASQMWKRGQGSLPTTAVSAHYRPIFPTRRERQHTLQP